MGRCQNPRVTITVSDAEARRSSSGTANHLSNHNHYLLCTKSPQSYNQLIEYILRTMAETGNLAAKMDVDEAAIDEGLYSRQL